MPGLGESFVENSELIASVKRGRNAINRSHNNLLDNDLRILDSLNLDEATRQRYPQDHRWDYLVSSSNPQILIGIEPHSAISKEVKVVIQKRRNALRFLSDHLRNGQFISKWFWVASGRVGFSNSGKDARLLHKNGIIFAGRRLTRRHLTK
ncbi:MAG: hypothetical protein HYW48_02510 [Deltaproteobacteria bacterium]|nr:hypothetical protein [Deltaproteobacteria bacterium]